ncbi:lactonase family protein [Alteromonas sp. NFXS44]|uniref:lactonase family protein n=1 Tax=Alteromonas sp. NFXS44 TaxID=2818435 RepID=UPI0032DEC6E4
MFTLSRRAFLAGASVVACYPLWANGISSDLQRFVVGTFTNSQDEDIPTDFGIHRKASDISEGIYAFTLNTKSGQLSQAELVANVSNPVNLITHPTLNVLYACRGQGTQINGQNVITAYRWHHNHFVELNSVMSGGLGPTVGQVSHDGKQLLTTHFASDSIVAIPLAANGALLNQQQTMGKPFVTGEYRIRAPGEETHRDSWPEMDIGKPHDIQFSQTQRYAIATEIAANRCRVLKVDKTSGRLLFHSVANDAPGAGPRHIAWHPGFQFLYTSGEGTSSVSAWRWNEHDGTLTLLQNESVLPLGYRGDNHTADIVMHPSGKWVFVSNRGAGSIASFSINSQDGRFTLHQHVELSSPSCWSMQFDKTGQWALVTEQIADQVSLWRCDVKSGDLIRTENRVRVVLPSCIRNWV